MLRSPPLLLHLRLHLRHLRHWQLRQDRPCANALRPPAVRQRSSTMITGVPLSAQMNGRVHQPPEKPFAMRRNSPASSTGDSSSGRAPLTPRDGSDIVARQDANGGVNGIRKHIKRRSGHHRRAAVRRPVI
ncbi:hypothetical protein BJ912DRAFT_215411 [Pholiota molesta]|nr:hypothetical protein BJ912DRAFT_215411 [Pholiota molesta]